ncbi:protein ENHANCED DOWNY MILDEW 2-like [Salvia splendens]|uniref:protein ENHANCED DOWNY MILDEW 2-like n=1 Tax=Salvia splendens TaxID=180675 RepID=UPI001C25CDE0|nr:protein ENHANCED DOWNY MILDEW 2-like [Salvia splendens]
MASSDDEGDVVTTTVSDYEFTGGVDEESISFAKLPVEWSEGNTGDGKQLQIYLRGKTDNGLRTIYVQVTAWKFNLLKGKPEISVLQAQGSWIKLLKPWKPYYDIIRTALVTVYALHFAKWNPQRSQKALWDNLKDTLSMFERMPCVDDLADHVPLITESIKWDTELENSKLLSAFLAEKPWEKKTSIENVRHSFIVDDINWKEDQGDSEEADKSEDSEPEEGDKADENDDSDSNESDCFDSVCAFCDNGGDLLICDGKCMRSFHATVKDGEESQCLSLGFTKAELKAIKNVPFICDHCKYKKHQCFACGKLGSSDELSNPEVFCCVNGACGYFYHPHCVATLLHPGDDAATEELEKRIANGEPFACPIHKCHVCKELELRSTHEMQFAVCRRCPKAYHRKCLPSDIRSEDDSENEIVQRAWEGLIPKRLLIYCLAHDIDKAIMTPLRDHIVFPGSRQEKKKMLELESSQFKRLPKGKGLAFKDNAGNRISEKQQKGNGAKGVGLSRKRLKELPTPSSKKQKLANTRTYQRQFKRSLNDEGRIPSVDRSYATFSDTESEPLNPRSVATGHAENTKEVKPNGKTTDNTFTLDADAKRRVLTLMKAASSSVKLVDVKRRHKPPSQALYSRFSTDNVTMGKVEGSVQAVHAALKKLDEGNVRDAKAVCGEELLQQVLKWKEKLKIYLAPFLHGMRYTSFGRHFTKIDKLKDIADILRWYVQDGDMLVDFCCGSNDFSCLIKEKLDEMGRVCSFKNYDILQAKNDYNFERRDWMGVKKEELPDGSKLIMGLNPPFGVNAALANKFISKALEFNPKLLILIVPRETQRLDEKVPPYDLIWEDDQMLAGKSFYLPGSVDVNNKQIEDWNISAPVLYLWSSRAWTNKHKAIAESHSHHSGALKNCRLDTNHNEPHTTNSGQVFHGKSSSARGEDKPADTPKTLGQNTEEIALCHGEVLDNETVSHSEGLPGDINSTFKELEQKEENISHRDDLPHDINSSFRNLEQKEKATISHSNSFSRNFNSSSTNLDKKERKTISHKDDLPHSRGVGKRHAAVKNHSETSRNSVGGREDKKRSPSNMFPKDRSSGKLKVPRHLSPDVSTRLRPYPTESRETTPQVLSERGERHQVARVPLERGDRWQSRQVAGRDDHRQQQLSQGKFPTPQSYSQVKDSVEVSDLLKKYGAEELQHGMRVEQAYDAHRLPQGQAYNPHHPPQHDISGGQAYTHRLPQHGMSGGQIHDAHQPHQRVYDWRSSQGYASPAASVQSMGSPAPPFTSYSGDVRSIGSPALPYTSYPGEMNVRSQESAVPPYQHQYGLAGASSSSYGEMRAPAAQRYAARLHEPHHARMDPTPPPNQGPLGFAQGPYYPHNTNSGWLRD